MESRNPHASMISAKRRAPGRNSASLSVYSAGRPAGRTDSHVPAGRATDGVAVLEQPTRQSERRSDAWSTSARRMHACQEVCVQACWLPSEPTVQLAGVPASRGTSECSSPAPGGTSRWRAGRRRGAGMIGAVLASWQPRRPAAAPAGARARAARREAMVSGGRGRPVAVRSRRASPVQKAVLAELGVEVLDLCTSRHGERALGGSATLGTLVTRDDAGRLHGTGSGRRSDDGARLGMPSTSSSGAPHVDTRTWTSCDPWSSKRSSATLFLGADASSPRRPATRSTTLLESLRAGRRACPAGGGSWRAAPAARGPCRRSTPGHPVAYRGRAGFGAGRRLDHDLRIR